MTSLDIESVSDVIRRGSLRWFGHVEHKQPDDWVSACRHIVAESVKDRGHGRPRECVEEDMAKLLVHMNVRYGEMAFWKTI